MDKYLINPNHKISKINKDIYGHFAEHLGRCIYEGIYVGENSKIPNVNGIKEATGDLAFAAKVAAETDLVLYSGNDDVIVPIMSLGGKGVISVAANIIPQEIHDICAKYMEGNTTESKEIFLKYLKLLNTLFIEVNPIPVKTAMGLMGMDSGILRQPLFEMEDKNLETLKSVLKEYDLLKQQ